ncbi:MAG TPA: hypothetical protein VMT64_03330, partial [Candidatus Binataceae bacterium]|nr:hypothetical protein [Candidatus Binataceae bacterium]
MNVKVKLMVLCGAFLAGIVIFAAVSYSTIEAIRIGGERDRSLADLRNFSGDLTMPTATLADVNTQLYRIVLGGDEKQLELRLKDYSVAEKEYRRYREDRLQAVQNDPELKAAYEKTLAPTDEFLRVVNTQIIPLAVAGKLDEARNVRYTVSQPLFGAHWEAVNQLNELVKKRITEEQADVATMVTNRMIFTYSVLAICLLIAIVLGIRIENGIVDRLREKVAVLKKVSEGDLSSKLEIRAR